jgi:2-dehydro-3-deoxygluconokinase
VYFVEKGAAQRPSKVVYDRANSSIATATPEDFDWPQILSGSSWFHTTGITPALSESAARICQQALCAAKQAGCTTSFDLNFRKNLWSSERANEVLAPMMEYVDICIANEEDAESVFGIKAEQSDVEKGKIDGESYKQVATKMVERFGFKACAITLRESLSASDNGWSALYYDGTQFYESKRYMVHIVDRVGGGDSFAAGLVYSLLNNRHPGKAVEFAVAASCLKHSIEGDYNAVTASEVEKLAQGKASGRVER